MTMKEMKLTGSSIRLNKWQHTPISPRKWYHKLLPFNIVLDGDLHWDRDEYVIYIGGYPYNYLNKEQRDKEWLQYIKSTKLKFRTNRSRSNYNECCWRIDELRDGTIKHYDDNVTERG